MAQPDRWQLRQERVPLRVSRQGQRQGEDVEITLQNEKVSELKDRPYGTANNDQQPDKAVR